MKTMPAIIAEMRALLVVANSVSALGKDATWHLTSIKEDLDALYEIHVEEPRRAEEAEQARHEDVMENGSYASRKFELFGDSE